MSKELIRLVACTMAFDGETVLDSIDLYIHDKEFLTLLGPSGCGKTTTLRIIGGFLKPSSGDVLFDGERFNRRFDEKGQALCSWRLKFAFTTPAGELEYLNGRTFQAPLPDFVEKYFKSIKIH